MVTISFFFWTLIALFAIIGAMRGWAKEILVTFSLVMALFVMQIGLAYIGPVKKLWESMGGSTQFYTSSLVIILFAFFGYHTPNTQMVNKNLSRDNKSTARHWLQDMMLGGILGAGNGYLLVGTIWFFLDLAKYPVPEYILTAPEAGTRAGDAALKLIYWLPPIWLEIPIIYFVVAVVFTFVIIVLI
ncbi:MAG: CvpA family protein [Candidatus Electrothrix sp.]